MADVLRGLMKAPRLAVNTTTSVETEIGAKFLLTNCPLWGFDHPPPPFRFIAKVFWLLNLLDSSFKAWSSPIALFEHWKEFFACLASLRRKVPRFLKGLCVSD